MNPKINSGPKGLNLREFWLKFGKIFKNGPIHKPTSAFFTDHSYTKRLILLPMLGRHIPVGSFVLSTPHPRITINLTTKWTANTSFSVILLPNTVLFSRCQVHDFSTWVCIFWVLQTVYYMYFITKLLAFFPADSATQTEEKKNFKEKAKRQLKKFKVCYKHVTTKSNIYKITYHYVKKEYCAF